MQKAFTAQASAEDNNMFLLDHCSFYERKTRHFEKIFSLPAHNSAGDIYFGLSSTQNHLNTQHTMKRASKLSPSLTRLLMPIPNKATEKACLLLPERNHIILRLLPTFFSILITTKTSPWYGRSMTQSATKTFTGSKLQKPKVETQFEAAFCSTEKEKNLVYL